jgi:hypothetical protein
MSLRFWIRVNARLADDPAVQEFALVILPKQPDWIAIPAACGFLGMLWGRVADERENGDLTDIPSATLERWVGWQGKRGLFAAEFRARFVDEHGVIKEWQDYQGALLERRRQDRERKKRGKRAESPQEGSTQSAGIPAEAPQDVQRTSSVNGNDHPEYSAPYGAENTQGSPLAPAPDGARPAPGTGDYLDRPTVRDELLRRGVRVPENLPALDAPANRADEYAQVLTAAVNEFLERFPIASKEIGRQCRREQKLPMSGDLTEPQIQRLRGEVTEKIRQQLRWPTERSWQGEALEIPEDFEPSVAA